MAQAQVQSQQGQGQQQKQQSVVSAVGKKKGSGEVGDCDSGEQSEMQEKGAVGYRKRYVSRIEDRGLREVFG